MIYRIVIIFALLLSSCNFPAGWEQTKHVEKETYTYTLYELGEEEGGIIKSKTNNFTYWWIQDKERGE